MKPSLVLFSGGIDSTTALYWALAKSKKVQALTFDYGQRHRTEIIMARRLTRMLGVPHFLLKVNLRQIGGSSLTDQNLPLPQYKKLPSLLRQLPSTYVPFRNGIFLALAAAWAEVNHIPEIICGFNVIDSPDYPDTREKFVQAMEKAIRLGTPSPPRGKKINILAPFVKMKKSEIIQLGISLGANYSYSLSCYAGHEIPCQKCSACLLRRRAWKEAGREDPLILRLKKRGKI
ncbi:MAG: 7-cyano-7-deazaguanine synthase QueC [Candidatus Aminicenantales bacterium]